MSIKSAIIKKKLEKTGSMMDIMLFNTVVEKIDAIISANAQEEKEKHTAFSTEKHEEFEKMVAKNVQSLSELVKILESRLTDVAENDKKEMEGVLATIKNDIAGYKTSCMEYFDTYAKESVENLRTRMEQVLSDTERFKGTPGDKGDKGDDGSPDTPEQVVDKVNNAKKKVKLSAIDGLIEQIASLKSGVRGKSGKAGGMGDPQHESHNISAVTTSVTLAYPVAAGGHALWCYYQGQFLVYGVHYTVNRSVITLTLDNQIDGTYLDVTYIRGS